MLQILVYGADATDFLDLAPGTSLQVQEVKPAFDEDLSIGEYSLPIDVPWTGKNRRILSFAEMLQPGNDTYYWRCDVYSDGLPEIIDGKLTMLKKKGLFSYNDGSYSFSISGSKGLFGSMVKKKKLTDLRLGGRITWAALSARAFGEGVMKGEFPEVAAKICFGPVAIEEFFDTERKDYNDEFIVFDTVNNILVTGAGTNSWSFARPTSANPAVAAAVGTAEYVDYRTIPFFNFYFVLKSIFAEFGHTVTGDFFSKQQWTDLYLFNNFAIEKYDETFHDNCREIIPSNHVPDILIKDFLVESFRFFNLEMLFRANRTVEIRYKHTGLRDKHTVNLTDKTSMRFDADQLSYAEDGFTLKFDFDSEDSYPSDRVQELKDLTLVGTVLTRQELLNIDPGRQLTTDDIAFVTAENMYYKVANATVSPVLWDCFSEKLGEYKIGAGDTEIAPTLSPLCTYARENTVTALVENMNRAGCRQKGSFYNTKGLAITNPFGLRIFYLKKVDTAGVSLPTTFVNARDDQNTKRVEISLCWEGADGLYEKLHKTWITFLQKTLQVATKLYVDQAWLEKINQASLLEINGILFVPYSISKQLPLRDAVDVTLYRYSV